MSADIILVVCVRTNVTMFLGPTSAAAPQASSWPVMAETVMVRQDLALFLGIVSTRFKHIFL